MAALKQIKIGSTTYNLADVSSPITISDNLVSSSGNSVVLSSWLNKIFRLSFYYTTTFYDGTTNGWFSGKIGGQNTAWKLQNKCSYVQIASGNQFGSAILHYNSQLILVQLFGTSDANGRGGEVFFYQRGGQTLSHTTSYALAGSVSWLRK